MGRKKAEEQTRDTQMPTEQLKQEKSELIVSLYETDKKIKELKKQLKAVKVAKKEIEKKVEADMGF